MGQEHVICFYHENEEYGCFSNWYSAAFSYAGRVFPSTEHFMMYHKVLMFHQYDLADKILQADNPAEAKKLGRTHIQGFNAKV